jgi:hypothetical protein
MKLAELTLPISYADARGYALVFTPTIAAWLADLHRQYGSPNCVPMPRALTDGRLMLGADLLTEIGPGGLLEAMWAAADKQILGRAIEVVPWADAVALLPPDDNEAAVFYGERRRPWWWWLAAVRDYLFPRD